jgi:hypothetical protein
LECGEQEVSTTYDVEDSEIAIVFEILATVEFEALLFSRTLWLAIELE